MGSLRLCHSSWEMRSPYSLSFSFVSTFSSLFSSHPLQKSAHSKVMSCCSWYGSSPPMLNTFSATVKKERFCVSQGYLIWKNGNWARSQLDWGVTCPLSLSKNQSHWQPEPSARGGFWTALCGDHSSVQSGQEGWVAAVPHPRGAGNTRKWLPQASTLLQLS